VTPDELIASLPPDRAKAIAAVRRAVKRALPKGFAEGVYGSGIIAWFVPPAKLPATYNGQPFQIAALASQKQYMALYLMPAYGPGEKAFKAAYARTGKKLDMGKACIRFKVLDDLALEPIIELLGKHTVDDWIAVHQSVHGARKLKKIP